VNKAYTSPTVLLFVHITYTVTMSYSNVKKDHHILAAHKINIFKVISKHVYFLKSSFKK